MQKELKIKKGETLKLYYKVSFEIDEDLSKDAPVIDLETGAPEMIREMLRERKKSALPKPIFVTLARVAGADIDVDEKEAQDMKDRVALYAWALSGSPRFHKPYAELTQVDLY